LSYEYEASAALLTLLTRDRVSNATGILAPVDEPLEEARRYVRRKRIFYTVLGIWIVLSVMWFTIDLLDDSSSFWFYWPMLGTGIGVAITGIVLFGLGGLFGADWERREIDRYLRRRGNDPSVSSETFVAIR
jgi:2TM domain